MYIYNEKRSGNRVFDFAGILDLEEDISISNRILHSESEWIFSSSNTVTDDIADFDGLVLGALNHMSRTGCI